MNMRPVQPKPAKVLTDPAYLAKVRQLPCCACGRHAPNEAHHCRDLPDYEERGTYDRVPGAGMKSGDRDAIPLCPPCHRMFHLARPTFHARSGKDYTHIPTTRATLSDMEISF